MGQRAKEKPQFSLPYVAVISGVASCTAEFATFPFDWAKTRLQLNGQIGLSNVSSISTPRNLAQYGSRSAHQGMFRTIYEGVSKEGPFALFNGLKPALVRQATYGTLKMTMYQHFKERFANKKMRGDHVNLISAAASGALSSALCNPTDLVKVRLQGGDPKFQYRGMTDAFSSIVRLEGWKGLYKGVWPTTQRATLITLLTLPTYDFAKQALLNKDHELWNFHSKDDFGTHFLASIFSAVVSTLGTQPIDVVKSRMMNQPFDENGVGVLYRSSFDCLVKTVQTEGLFACWKGVIPTFFRSGPWCILFWCTYEQLMRITVHTPHSL